MIPYMERLFKRSKAASVPSAKAQVGLGSLLEGVGRSSSNHL